MTEAEVSQFTSMRVSGIRPSPDNPRKHIDAGALEQLAQNIREHGVISPLVVRPIGVGPAFGPPDAYESGMYEIVSGERRWRASKIAGLAEVPVRILQLSDAAALEIQVIENLQRSDIHELEEADGYKALQDRYGYTVEALAAKVGKSVAYIYGRLKLCALVDETAREAFFSRTIAPTVALFISRLDRRQQGEAAKMVLTHGWDEESGEKAPMNTGQALRVLRQQYTLKLAAAPFSTESEELVPAAGPCTTCPKRTGNAPTLFAVETPDVCTDAACYTAKTKRHFAILVEDAKASGRTVIEGKAAKEIFPWDSTLSLAAGWVRADAREWLAEVQERPWKERLGEHMPPPTLVVHPKTREVVEVLSLAELKAAKKAAGIKSAFREHDDAAVKPGQAEEEKKKAKREEEKRKERVERAKAVAAEALDIICGRIAQNESHFQKSLAFALAAHPCGRIAMVDEQLLPEKDRQVAWEYDRTVAKAASGLNTHQLVFLLVRATAYGQDPHDAVGVPVHPFTGEYSAELKALAGLFESEVSLKDLEKKATSARLRAAAVAEQAKKADAAIEASAPKPSKAPSKGATAMAEALANAKPGKVKKPVAKAKSAKGKK